MKCLFCENLKFYRMQNGYNQKTMAETLGISPSTYCLYEKGEREPGLGMLKLMAQTLGVSADDLLGLPRPGYEKMMCSDHLAEPRVHYSVSAREWFNGPYTVEDYFAYEGEDRIELLYGHFIPINTPSVKHQRVVGGVYAELRNYIGKKKGICETFMSPISVVLSEEDGVVFQPDVLVVCNPDIIEENKINGSPELVVEVLSPSTRHYDLFDKLEAYKRYEVSFYLAIDIQKEKVILYDLKEKDLPLICSFWDSFKIPLFEDLEICLEKLL